MVDKMDSIKSISPLAIHFVPFALLCSIRLRRLISPLIGRDAAGSKVENSLILGNKFCHRGRPKIAS
jgi:hypothetical protein